MFRRIDKRPIVSLASFYPLNCYASRHGLRFVVISVLFSLFILSFAASGSSGLKSWVICLVVVFWFQLVVQSSLMTGESGDGESVKTLRG